jgi:hypothetical protein
MRINSGIVDKAAIEVELAETTQMLCDAGVAELEMMFGWGCRGPQDGLYKSISVAPCDLLKSVKDEGPQVGFEIAECDLFLTLPERRLKIQFCHESDIHVEGEDEQLIQKIEERWRSKCFPGYRWNGHEWVPFVEWTTMWIHGPAGFERCNPPLAWEIDVDRNSS